MYGIIYKTTNLSNGKIYIGQHKCNTVDFDGYFGSGVVFTKALKKYGPENFKREVLSVVDSPFQADIEEKYYIEIFTNAFGRNNMYNISEGGQGGDLTKFWTPEYISKQSEISSKGWNDERKEKASKRMKELNNHLDRAVISLKLRGRKTSLEIKEKQSLSHMGKGTKRIICLETGEIYESIKEACEKLGVYQSGISNVLRGKYTNVKGLHFKFYI